MTCPLCDSVMVELESKVTCPKCDNLKILDSITASIIACKRKQIFQKIWKNELQKIQQKSLLLHIFRHREFVARDFWKKLGLIDIDSLFSDTLFLKRVMQEGNPDGNYLVDSIAKAEPIIKLFNETKKFETDVILIDSCYAQMTYDDEFEISTLSDDEFLSNFKIIQTEEYLKLKKSYENYNLYARKDAEKKFKENAAEFEKIKNENHKTQFMSREQFIQRNYETISDLYMALLRNELFSETFDLRSLSNLSSDPSRIIQFFNEFPRLDGALTEDDTDPFLNRCRKYFKKSLPVVRKTILFEPGNESAFPLVLRNIWDRDSVFLSQGFVAILYILLHAVITKDIFDDETGRRGVLFESKVQEKFENLGFKYIPNVKDDYKSPTLEIDGIAIKDDYCFVIEVKNRRLPPEVESSNVKKIMIFDLKGIVDGKKRATKDGERIIKNIKSLPEKINYVQSNLENLDLATVSNKKVFGLIITHDYPLISIYKNIYYFWLNDVTSTKLNKIIL